MNIRPALIAGGIGVLPVFATPLLALLLVYLSPAFFISPLAIMFRWCGVQFAILFLVGILYAAFADEPANAGERLAQLRGAALTAFLVGLAGAVAEVVARIVPEIMVATGVIGYTYLPLRDPVLVLPITCAGFIIFAGLGAAAGACGAAAFRAAKSGKPATKAAA